MYSTEQELTAILTQQDRDIERCRLSLLAHANRRNMRLKGQRDSQTGHVPALVALVYRLTGIAVG
jgi:hypothetical protein